MNRKLVLFWCVCLLTLIIAGIVIPRCLFTSINPSQEYWLSSKDLERLEERVALQKDGDAAFKIALYYERSEKDSKSFLLWLRRASDLGNPSAQKLWEKVKDYH